MPKDQSLGSRLKKLLFKPRPGTIAAKASGKLSDSQKRKIKDFRESFSGVKEKEKKRK